MSVWSTLRSAKSAHWADGEQVSWQGLRKVKDRGKWYCGSQVTERIVTSNAGQEGRGTEERWEVSGITQCVLCGVWFFIQNESLSLVHVVVRGGIPLVFIAVLRSVVQRHHGSPLLLLGDTWLGSSFAR